MTQNSLSNTVINLRDLYILSLTQDGSIMEYLFIPKDLYISNSERLGELKLNAKAAASRKYLNNLVTTKPLKNSVLHCIMECELNIPRAELIAFKKRVIEHLKNEQYESLSDTSKFTYKKISK